MFTGLIEEIGIVKEIQNWQGALRLTISAHEVSSDLAIDDSVAINGVCLTVINLSKEAFQVEAVSESLKKTTLASVQKGARINLERSLRFSDRLGGHLVQGHVDGVGQVTAVQSQAGGQLLSITLPQHLMKYIISEGSIAIDGVSLTVARLNKNVVTLSLISHTLKKTTLAESKVGDKVNIEVDLIGKYIENMLTNPAQGKISEHWLQKTGFE